MMQTIYRALYTRCINGINFQNLPSLTEGQKLFSTGGSMGLSKDVLSFIEAEIGRDIYRSGMRPYRGEACRFFSCGNGISVLIQYCWLRQEETGGREFGITKALIGAFDRHPMEYFSSKFFNGKDFFSGYPDAEGKEITSFRQLLTFQGGKVPPLFLPLTGDTLFSYDSYPVMSFENAGRYIRQSEKAAERLRAAVSHLVRQFELPESQRKGIIIRGTREQLRYWIAAIGYAFSARSAQKISFSIGFPPTGFSYDFSTSALTGWVTDDPDLVGKSNFLSDNLVYLERLPAADSNDYYKCIGEFGETHKVFVTEFLKRCSDDTVQSYPSLYSFNKSIIWLSTAAEEGIQRIDLGECLKIVNQYNSGNYFSSGFTDKVLKVTDSAVIRSYGDIECLIEIYSKLGTIIKKDKAEAAEQFREYYIIRFKCIFADILSGKYQFCNEISSAKEPMEYFYKLIGKNEKYAGEIAQALIEDKEAFDISGISLEYLEKGKVYLKKVVYPRLSFIFYIMEWCERSEKYIYQYICRAFEAVLVQYKLENLQIWGEVLPKEEIYKKVFDSAPESESLRFCDCFDVNTYRECGYSPEKIQKETYDKWLGEIFLCKFEKEFLSLEENRSEEISIRRERMKKLLMYIASEKFSEEDLYERCLNRCNFSDENNVFYYTYIEEYLKAFSKFEKSFEYWKDIWKKVWDMCSHLKSYRGEYVGDKVCGDVVKTVVSKLKNGRNKSDDCNKIIADIDSITNGNIYEVCWQPLLTALKDIEEKEWRYCCNKINKKIEEDSEYILKKGREQPEERLFDYRISIAVKSLEEYSRLQGYGMFDAVTRMNFYVDFCKCNTSKSEETPIAGKLKKVMNPYLAAGRIEAFKICSEGYKDALKSAIAVKKGGLTGEIYYLFLKLFIKDEKFFQEIVSKAIENKNVEKELLDIAKKDNRQLWTRIKNVSKELKECEKQRKKTGKSGRGTQ